MSASTSMVKPLDGHIQGSPSQRHVHDPSDARTGDVGVLFLTSFVPYPADHGGAMAREGFIRAIAASTRLSVLVLTSIQYDADLVRAAESYYRKFCESFVCRQFSNLSPNGSVFAKAWDYVTGRPRNGFWSREAEEVFADEVNRTGCQIMWCDTVFNAKYLGRARRMNCRTVLTNHNVESDLVRQGADKQSGFKRLKARLDCLDVSRLEKLGAREADVVTAITEADLAHYRTLKGDGVSLLGYSYPMERAKIDHSREEPGTICFVGSMQWQPNIRAAFHLVRDIMPPVWKARPDAKCYIVGKNPSPEVLELPSSHVIVTGEVPSLIDYYERAELVVAPLQEGGGIKIKVVEALALGKAVVSTSIGAAGLDVQSGTHLSIADDPAAFAAEMVRLLDDGPTRRRIAAAGREFARKRLSPEHTEHEVRAILEQLGVSPFGRSSAGSSIETADELV